MRNVRPQHSHLAAAKPCGWPSIGVLLLVGGNGGLAWAEQYVPTGFAALIIAVTPIWFLVLETFVFRGDRMSRRGLIGLAMGIVGIAILVWPKITHRDTLGMMQLVGSISLLFSSLELGGRFGVLAQVADEG